MNKTMESKSIRQLIAKTNALMEEVVKNQRLIEEQLGIREISEDKETKNVESKGEEDVERKVDLEKVVTDYIKKLGIPANLLGYYYCRSAILMVINEKGLLSQITKKIYPAIAKEYNTTSSRVERSIRHAIEVACVRTIPEVYEKIFGYTISSMKGKPTNSEFIAMVSEEIQMQLKK